MHPSKLIKSTLVVNNTKSLWIWVSAKYDSNVLESKLSFCVCVSGGLYLRGPSEGTLHIHGPGYVQVTWENGQSTRSTGGLEEEAGKL